jgi:repressor LexA
MDVPNEKTTRRIKELRTKKGLSQEQLAKILNIDRSTVNKYESGQSRPIRYINKLADLFGVSADYILGLDGESRKEQNPPPKIVKIPVLGYAAAGIPIEAITEIEGYEEIPAEIAEKGKYFAWRVKGYSMSPRIMPGDIAIVKVQRTFRSGDTCIVQINGNEAAIRQVYKSYNGITLVALNPSVFAPRFFTAEEVQKIPVQMIGVVIEIRIRNLKGEGF